MGWKFQKRVRILPGVTLNLSRKGVSTSVGRRGARVTWGHGQTRTTLGLPGTGISHTSVRKNRSNHPQPKARVSVVSIFWGVLVVLLLVIFTLRSI